MSEITLENGTRVYVPRVAVSVLMLEFARKHPKPLPPVVSVKLAGVETQERNYASKAYQEAVEVWDGEINGMATEFILRATATANRGRLTEQELAAVSDARSLYEGLIDPDQPDEQVWLRYVAISTNEDITLIIMAARLGEPREAGIAANASGFRGNG